MRQRRIKSVVITVIAVVLAIIFLYPFYIMIMMSTHVTESIYQGVPFFPGGYFIENVKTVFGANFEVYYKNSLIVACSATLLSIAVSTITGYAFAKYTFKGSKALFSFILITMMIPTQLGLVAFVVIMKNIGWMNTLLPLIIPGCASGFGVYWMKNFVSSAMPSELLESGRIDGASEPRILWSIALPCIKPAIFSLALMNFVSNWNAFLLPLIVLNKDSLYTVPIGLVNLSSMYRDDLAAKITALVIGIVPLLILFIITSKSFVRGITMGAVKG